MAKQSDFQTSKIVADFFRWANQQFRALFLYFGHFEIFSSKIVATFVENVATPKFSNIENVATLKFSRFSAVENVATPKFSNFFQKVSNLENRKSSHDFRSLKIGLIATFLAVRGQKISPNFEKSNFFSKIVQIAHFSL